MHDIEDGQNGSGRLKSLELVPRETGLAAKDFKSDQEVRWCPGCGDYAILAAFQQTRGRYVITLDADLQNPPEEIGRIVAAMDAGADHPFDLRRDQSEIDLAVLSERRRHGWYHARRTYFHDGIPCVSARKGRSGSALLAVIDRLLVS